MRRHRRVEEVVEAVQQVEAFVHSSRRASLEAVLADYHRDEPLVAPRGFRARSTGAVGEEAGEAGDLTAKAWVPVLGGEPGSSEDRVKCP